MKKFRRVLLLVAVFAMVIGQSISAAAAESLPTISSITVGTAAMAYTNGDAAEITVTYKWTKPQADALYEKDLKVVSSNRGVALVDDVTGIVNIRTVPKLTNQ